MRKLILPATLAMLSACTASPPPAPTQTPEPSATAPTPVPEATTPAPTLPADNATPAFVDKVWRVGDSSAVEAGSAYTFRSGGVLLITSPHGTPMTGSWSYDDDKLVMTEEGIAYPTDIVTLDAGHFTIRSHNPGGVVEIAMVAAPK